MMMKAHNRSILFDLDGTLVDSLQDIADSMNAVLHQQGHPVHPVEAYAVFVGDGMKQLAARALPPELREDSQTLSACVKDMKQEYSSRWSRHSAPYPGISEMLDALTSREIRMGILSNKPEAFTREMVTHFFPEIPFTTVRGAREGVPVKPDPTAPRDIVKEWRCSPDSVVYVGDTNTDMETGRAAGFRTIGVSWGFRDREELSAAGAHRVIDRPSELLTDLESR